MPETVRAGLYSRTLMPWQISGLSEESEKETIETNQTSISNQDQTKK